MGEGISKIVGISDNLTISFQMYKIIIFPCKVRHISKKLLSFKTVNNSFNQHRLLRTHSCTKTFINTPVPLLMERLAARLITY